MRTARTQEWFRSVAPVVRSKTDNGKRNHSWVLAVLLPFSFPLSRLGADTAEATERNCQDPGSVPLSSFSFPLSRLGADTEQRNGITPGSWQSSLSFFSFPLSRLGADTGATERNHSWVLAVLLQLPVVTSWSGHRSNGTEPLLGPGSPHSPPSASRCHVLERTQEQRNGTTPGSWQSSLSSFSFPLSGLGDTGATERNHSWVLAVLTLILQLPVVTSWSGHRSNGTESLLGPGSPHSPPSASRCHVLERTQEQRNGTTPGSWQSSFSFPLSRLERTQEQRNGTTPGSWQSSFSFPLSWS